MTVYSIVVKYGDSFRYLTGKSNNHTPLLTDNFCEAKTFTSRIDATEYARGMKRYKDELKSAGFTIEDGLFISGVEMNFVEKIEF